MPPWLHAFVVVGVILGLAGTACAQPPANDTYGAGATPCVFSSGSTCACGATAGDCLCAAGSDCTCANNGHCYGGAAKSVFCSNSGNCYCGDATHCRIDTLEQYRAYCKVGAVVGQLTCDTQTSRDNLFCTDKPYFPDTIADTKCKASVLALFVIPASIAAVVLVWLIGCCCIKRANSAAEEMDIETPPEKGKKMEPVTVKEAGGYYLSGGLAFLLVVGAIYCFIQPYQTWPYGAVLLAAAILVITCMGANEFRLSPADGDARVVKSYCCGMCTCIAERVSLEEVRSAQVHQVGTSMITRTHQLRIELSTEGKLPLTLSQMSGKCGTQSKTDNAIKINAFLADYHGWGTKPMNAVLDPEPLPHTAHPAAGAGNSQLPSFAASPLSSPMMTPATSPVGSFSSTEAPITSGQHSPEDKDVHLNAVRLSMEIPMSGNTCIECGALLDPKTLMCARCG